MSAISLAMEATRSLKTLFRGNLVSVSIVGSAAYRLGGSAGSELEPKDLDLVVLVDTSSVTGEDLSRVRSAVDRLCSGCSVYVAMSTYCHSMLSRPSIYVMVYPVSTYVESVSKLLRSSWANEGIPVYGQDLREISDPQVTADDVISDDYGIAGCLKSLISGVYETKPSVLGPGDKQPRKLRFKLEGVVEAKLLKYCWRWQAYNSVRAAGENVSPYKPRELVAAVEKLIGVEWPLRPPASRGETIRLLKTLAAKLADRGM